MQEMSLEECLEWCGAMQATVSFMFIYGDRRVQCVVPGSFFTERDSFIEAVNSQRIRAERQWAAYAAGKEGATG